MIIYEIVGAIVLIGIFAIGALWVAKNLKIRNGGETDAE